MQTEKTDKPTPKASAKIAAEGTEKDEAMELPKEDKNIVTWQFRYRNYRTILPYVDEAAGLTPTGKRSNAVMKARNYRRDLDLRIPEEKKMHKALLKDSRRDLDFWLLSDAKHKQKAAEQGQNLKKLLSMPEPQLRGMLSGDEMLAVGLNPATADVYDIAMAVITSYNKTLARQPEKENE